MGSLPEEVVDGLKRKFREHNVKLDQAFLAFDENNDGEISAAEFREGLRAMNMSLSSREVEDLIRHFDADGDGRISLNEFVRVFDYGAGATGGYGSSSGREYRMSDDAIRTMAYKFRDAGVNLKEAFLAFDDNNDGRISPAEFRRGIRQMEMSLSDREVEDLIRHFSGGVSGGNISYRDFATEYV